MKKRDFIYITREASHASIERAEKFNINSEDSMADRTEMVVDAITQNIKEIVECSNSSGYQEEIIEGIVKGLTGSHRYLQGEFMQALGKAMVAYSKVSTDARNEGGVNMAGRMGVASEVYMAPSDIEDMLARR